MDVGAKFEIHNLIRERGAAGMACLVVSSDLPEVLALADRILVMREGRMRGELPAADGHRGVRDAAGDARRGGWRMKSVLARARVQHGRHPAGRGRVLRAGTCGRKRGARIRSSICGNCLLIFKYSSIYGIAAIGAAVVIISGGIDLAPGAVIALTTVVTGYLFVEAGWPLWAAGRVGAAGRRRVAGLLSSWLIVRVRLPPFIATLGVMGILRGTAFIITEARFYDLSAKLPRELARRRRLDRLARPRS